MWTLHNGARVKPAVGDSAMIKRVLQLHTRLFGMLSLAAL